MAVQVVGQGLALRRMMSGWMTISIFPRQSEPSAAKGRARPSGDAMARNPSSAGQMDLYTQHVARVFVLLTDRTEKFRR